MAIYRGPGGAGDATNDATSQAIIAVDAAQDAIAARNEAEAFANQVKGVVELTQNSFSGDGSTTSFTLSNTPANKSNVLVEIDGVLQQTDAYSISGAVLTFTEAPYDGASIETRIIANTGTLNSAQAENVTFYQAGSGAITRKVQDRIRETVSIKDFGAVGDGVTDDTVAIQNALNTGKSVEIPDGNYVVSALTLSNSNVTLYGTGTLVKKPNVDGIVLTVSGSNNIVTGLRFDGTAPAPTANFVNDTIRISGSNNTISYCYLNGSKGGGIAILNASNNKILFNTILDSHDNNILIANGTSNNNLIYGNWCKGTTNQNNIFLTADSTSAFNGNKIYNNSVIGNHCENSGDTGIESGYHAYYTHVCENFCTASVNPPILVRDGFGVVVSNNIVVNTNYSSQSTAYDGIAVVPQSETASFNYSLRIANNTIIGKVKRSGIYVGGSFVEVSNNTIYDNETVAGSNGASLNGFGVVVGTGVSDVTIQGNSINTFEYGVNLNFGATSITQTNHKIVENNIKNTKTAINGYYVTFQNCRISNNVVQAVTTDVLKLVNATVNGQLYYVNNQVVLAGFTSVSPVEVNPSIAVITAALPTSNKTTILTVPETQYDYAIIKLASNQSAGVCTIQFADGSEVATFVIGGSSGYGTSSTSKVLGTSNLLDSTGSAGFSGWSLFYNVGNQLILQRRGISTGASARYFKVVINDC